VEAVRYYSTNQDDKMPPAGRLQRGAEVLFWDFLEYRGVAGERVVLWFPEHIPWNLRFLNIFPWSLPCGALFTIGLFLIHIYMGVFAERGAFGSVIRGECFDRVCQALSPRLVDEIVGGSSYPRK